MSDPQNWRRGRDGPITVEELRDDLLWQFPADAVVMVDGRPADLYFSWIIPGPSELQVVADG